MKLYEVPKKRRIKVLDESVVVPYKGIKVNQHDVLHFDRLDGMYSHCRNSANQVVHIAAWTTVEVVDETSC